MNCGSCGAKLKGRETFCPCCGAEQRSMSVLVSLAAQGDEQAISELYGRTYNAVYASIKAKARVDEDTVLDVIQDAYVKGFQSLNQLQNPEQFQAWMKTIAMNRLRDVLKKNRPTLFSELFPEEEDTVIDFEDERVEHLPDVVVDRQETARLIAEILDTLTDEQRMAVVLYYYEEMSVKEIAEYLECSENTVKSRLNYARKKIKAQVEDLERRGTKLYGLAPLPFLLLLLRNAETYGPALSASAATAASGAGAAGGAGTAAAQSAVGTAASGAAATAAGAAGSGVVTKIVAGSLAALLAVGGGVGAAKLVQTTLSPPAAVEQAESAEAKSGQPEQEAFAAQSAAAETEAAVSVAEQSEESETPRMTVQEVEREPEKTPEELYAPVLDMFYYNASANWEHYYDPDSESEDARGWYNDDPLKIGFISFVCYHPEPSEDYTVETLGYSFQDLDSNGTPELIIGADNELKAGKIVDLYTYKDGKLYHILSTGERWDYTLNKDSTISYISYGGTGQSRRLLRLKKGATSMTVLEELDALWDYEGAHITYYPKGASGPKPSEKVSLEEWDSIYESWLDPKEYSLTHFSDYTPHSKTPVYEIDKYGKTVS